MGTINGLHPERLAHAKFAYTTGRVRREEATCLLNGDRVPGLGDVVLAVRVGDDAVAYPVRQMAYHHVVQDTVGGVPIVATY